MKFHVRDAKKNVLATTPDHSSARTAFERLACKHLDAMEASPRPAVIPIAPHEIVNDAGVVFGARERRQMKPSDSPRAPAMFAVPAPVLAALETEARKRNVLLNEIVEIAIRADHQPLLTAPKEKHETLKVHIGVATRDRLVRAASAYRSTASDYGAKVLIGFVEEMGRRAA